MSDTPPSPPTAPLAQKIRVNPITQPAFANSFAILVDDLHTRVMCADQTQPLGIGPIHTILVVPNADALALAREILKVHEEHQANQQPPKTPETGDALEQ